VTIIYIDAYNILHGSSPFKEICAVDLEAARSRLIDHLARHCAHTEERIIIVFDGTSEFAHLPDTTTEKHLDVVFTKGGMSADTYIQRMMRKVRDSKDDYIVVSADNAVAMAASSMGAVAIGPEMFLRHIDHAHGERRQGLEGPGRKPHHARVEELISTDDERRLKSVKEDADQNDDGDDGSA
jgi:predicted RNA-binding protein with PIN domain